MSYSKVDVRLARDIEMLLNSPFWIESLRNGHARGISQQLNLQLIESRNFIIEFVNYAVKCNQSSIQDTLISGTNQIIDINNNVKENTSVRCLNLSVEFLIEIIFLSVLNFDDYIGTSCDIVKTILAWFPELRNLTNSVLKSTTETILSTTVCFKRCVKKTTDNIRPTILCKRQHKWSVNQNYIKPFVRLYYKNSDAKNVEVKLSNFVKNDHLTQVFSIPMQKQLPIIPFKNPRSVSIDLSLCQLPDHEHLNTTRVNRTSLFTSWKSKVEQFRLLLQIQHNNAEFFWYDSVDKFEFIGQINPIRRPQKTKLQEHNPCNIKPKAARKDIRKPGNKTEISASPVISPALVIPTTEPPTTTTFQLENILTCDDVNVKNHHVSSMISIPENYNACYFNLLPVSPNTMCYTHNFFSHQSEIGCVEEMFSDSI